MANPPSKTHCDEDIEESGDNPVENNKVIEEATDHKEDTSKQSICFECEDCEYKNETEKGVKQHTAGKHKDYQCEICSFKNASKATAE